jgi:hypothetical protein
MWAPPEMDLNKDELLLAKKPLYSVPESWLHWFLTYHGHHTDNLVMRVSNEDTFLLYHRIIEERGAEKTDELTILQVDDSFGHGTEAFLDSEELGSSRFDCKPRLLFNIKTSARFNGTNVQVTMHRFTIHQRDRLDKIRRPETDKDLISVRAAFQHIAGCTRPDIASCVQLLSSAVASPTKQTYKEMAQILNWLEQTDDLQLKFVPLDMQTLRIVVFIDASFANASNSASQLVFVVCLVLNAGNENTVHYGSQRCKRVTRLVMAAELHALSYVTVPNTTRWIFMYFGYTSEASKLRGVVLVHLTLLT